jgi:hypothetical protein
MWWLLKPSGRSFISCSAIGFPNLRSKKNRLLVTIDFLSVLKMLHGMSIGEPDRRRFFQAFLAKSRFPIWSWIWLPVDKTANSGRTSSLLSTWDREISVGSDSCPCSSAEYFTSKGLRMTADVGMKAYVETHSEARTHKDRLSIMVAI